MGVTSRFNNCVVQFLFRQWLFRHEFVVSRRRFIIGHVSLLRVVGVGESSIKQADDVRKTLYYLKDRLTCKSFFAKTQLDIVKNSKLVRVRFVNNFAQSFIRRAETVTKMLRKEPANVRIRGLLNAKFAFAFMHGEERIVW